MSSSDIQECAGTEFPSCDFPAEVVDEILLRLPVAPLVRFKLVAKSWRVWIDDPGFANKHLCFGSENGRPPHSVPLFILWNHVKLPLTVVPPPILQGTLLVNICDEGDDGSSDVIACVVGEIDLPHLLKTKLALEPVDYLLAGSHCNGLICLSEVSQKPVSKVFMCNPALKQLVSFTLPFFDPALFVFVGEGFGYDSRTDDYKFVRIWSSWNFTQYRAHLFSLANNSWREIEVPDLKIAALGREAAYCDGVYYWRSMDRQHGGTGRMVVAFDMSKEKFRRMKLPAATRDAPMYWNQLSLWKKSVVFFNMIENSAASTVFEMWVMVDKSGRGSWVKHLTIGPLEDIQVPVGFWNDEELFLGTMGRDLVSYNLSTKKIRKLPIGNVVPPSSYHFEHYTESLVPVKR